MSPLLQEELKKIQASSSLLVSLEDISAACSQIATQIDKDIGQTMPLVLTVMIGGLIPTSLLISHFSFLFEHDYIHATRYGGKTTGDSELEFRALPKTPLKDRTVLIIDDILDGGVTLAELVTWCINQGAAQVKTFVLADKETARMPTGLVKADYAAVTIPNYFVYGCGMDYKNYLREAKGIFAVDESLL